MDKYIIKIACKVWSGATAEILFARMPYVLEEFHFVESPNPDFYLFSKEKDHNAYKNCIKIYMPGENIEKINMGICHWAFGEKYEDEVHSPFYMRLPNYTRLGAGLDLVKTNYKPEKILYSKEKFCAFVYKNGGVDFRNNFYKALNAYKTVDSPGAVFNNMPSIDPPGTMDQYYKSYDTKVAFLRKYKFTIAFANERSRGYTSEKIYHAMLANCIPIYWGNPLVHVDFNPKSFINVHDFKSAKDVIDRIIEVDKNDSLYLQYLAQPWYHHNIPTQYTDPNVIMARFRKIFLRG